MLSQNQKEISDKVFQFLLSKDREMIISGTAGTGKSFLLKHLHQTIKKEYLDACAIIGVEPTIKQFKFTALSHKAVSILRDNLNVDVKTLHSHLQIKIWNNFSTGKEETKLPKFSVESEFKNTLLIIDEYSMIDYKIKDYLASLLNKYPTLKILYVGDHNQLCSPNGSSEDKFKFIAIEELTENFRIQNQDLLKTVNQLKANVYNKKIPKLNDFKNIFKIINKTELLNHYIPSMMLDLNHNNAFLNYTNKTTLAFNNYLRKLRNLPEKFTVNEKLVNSSIYKHTKNNILIPSEYELTVLNSNPDHYTFIDSIDDFKIYKILDSSGYEFSIPVNFNYYQNLLKHFFKNKNWKIYYKLKEEIADLRSKDAMTVHKSQGSTFDNVIINFNDILSCKSISTKIRLLYVAFSRAKYEVILYDNTIY